MHKVLDPYGTCITPPLENANKRQWSPLRFHPLVYAPAYAGGPLPILLPLRYPYPYPYP